ncbi:Tautomerase/MIF superfamily [Geopyxis carbonaria]|nr:Tautomerase/MIF superfamily [Geopyxis carbonaria]
MATLEPAIRSPQSAGLTGVVPPSPAPTALSFNPGDDGGVTCFGNGETTQRSPKAIEFITQEIDRDTPAAPRLQKKSSKGNVSRKRSMKGADYYGEVFAYREQGPAIPQSAGVYVELKTNVILENEFEFAKSFSEMIAKRYGRPEEAVCISLDHSACMIMGGTFDGTYFLTITSVSLVSPTVNKRNSALISEWISQNLGVPGKRGYIRFVDPDFANFATGGFTMLDLMEKEELIRTGTTERTGVFREKSIKRSMSRHRSKKERDDSDSAPYKAPAMPPPEPKDSTQKVDERPNTSSSRMRRKSMFHLFSKSQRTTS